jgi:hypothetical protein
MHRSWVVSLILASALRGAAAQQPGAAPGSRIRVTHTCRVADDGSTRCYSRRSGRLWRHTGTFVGVHSDTMLLKIAEHQAEVHLPLTALRRLETPHGQKSRWAMGAGIGLLTGAVAGGVIGGASGASSDPDFAGLHAIAGFILGVPAGFVVGAIAGSFFKTDRWVAVPISAMGPMEPHSSTNAYGISIRLWF